MSIGDVNSTEKGSAARYNDGKPELAQIPMGIWMNLVCGKDDANAAWVMSVLNDWNCYQATGTKIYLRHAVRHIPKMYLEEAARVLEYGAKKYKQWNWTKGQPWSVPFNSGLRHVAAWLEGEEFDEESNRLHLGHFACNAIFLAYYVYYYPEGEDWVCFNPQDGEEDE